MESSEDGGSNRWQLGREIKNDEFFIYIYIIYYTVMVCNGNPMDVGVPVGMFFSHWGYLKCHFLVVFVFGEAAKPRETQAQTTGQPHGIPPH